MTAKTKTAAEIGEGDRVIRRTETGRRTNPLVGEVVGRFASGKLRVRWDGTYPRFRGGMQTIHSTLKPGALLLATEENIAASQRRMYLRMAKGYSETVEEYERRADAIDARGGNGAMERRVADAYREKLREVRRRLEGQGTTEPLHHGLVVERSGK